MNRTIKWAFLLLALFWSSTACEFGIAVPTPASEEVELSVLVQPADKGYVEMNGSIIAPGVSVPVKRGKLVNLVARSSDEGWEFARWERGLTGTSSEEALLMDSTKVVLAVFASISPIASAPEPTRTPVAGQGSPSTTSGPTSTPVAEPVSPTATPTPTSTPPSTPVPPPVASFSVNLSSGSAPLAVQFSDTSLGTITSWQWDFGDGGTSAERSPIHRYTIAGSHTARLTVSGPGGTDTSVLADSITVQPGPPVSLEVSPSSATLAVQKVARFEAVARDEFGNDVLSAITWSTTAGGGSIRPDGLFTAGTIAGAFSDTVTASLLTDTLELIASASVTVEPGPLFEASIHPTETSLDIGSVQSFEVGMRDRFGNPIPEALISWKTTEDAGTVNADGQFTAGTKAGSFPGAVQVEAVTGGERASAAADVSIGPDPLATIEVQPSFIVVEKGITQQFLAAGFDLYGNEIPDLAFLWEATGGDITQDGLYTAGGESGSYEVSVAANLKDSTRSGSATVAIPPLWIPVGNMSVARAAHDAVLLPDGKVLIVSQGAEIYDPVTRTFAAAGNTSCANDQGSRATLLADGTVLITGEAVQPRSRCAEVYDSETGVFSSVGELNADHWMHSSTLLADGRVLVVGGLERVEDGEMTHAVVEIYDPVTETFSVTGSLNSHRRQHTATALPSGQVLITGGAQYRSPFIYGSDWPGFCLFAPELYDPSTGTSSSRSGGLNGCGHSATLLNNGKVLLTSHDRVAFLFDPETGTFHAAGAMTSRRGFAAATLLPNGQVLITGGWSTFPQFLATAELYDPEAGTFTATDAMIHSRQEHTATLLPNGHVLVTGGSTNLTTSTGEIVGQGDTNSAELWIPSNPSALPPPSASFSVDVESGVAPLEVRFAHTSQGPLTSVEWDFGDGTTSTEYSPSHTYTTAGSHSVRLTALGPGGADTIVMPDLITVEPGPLSSVVVEPAEVAMDPTPLRRRL